MNGFYIWQPALRDGLPGDGRVQVTGAGRRVLTSDSPHMTGPYGESRNGNRQQAGCYRPHQGEEVGHWGAESTSEQQLASAGERH